MPLRYPSKSTVLDPASGVSRSFRRMSAVMISREAAIDNAVPLPAITASLFARFASRQDDSPQMKMIAALRNQFGGHAVEKK